MGKVHTCILLIILNILGFSPGEFWWRMLDIRENRVFFTEVAGPVCFIISTDNKPWLQLLFPIYEVTRWVLIVPSLEGMMGDGTATVKSWCEFPKKVYDEEIHGCKFYLPDAFRYAWHIPDIHIFLIFPPSPSCTSSFSWVPTLRYHFRRTWFMKYLSESHAWN